jgi:peptidoglycan/LPS O-acetylase OafA/YrhL
MGKYTKFARKKPQIERRQHPLWRGIGCILILIVPPISFMIADLTVGWGLAHGWPLPAEMLGYIKFPDWVWQIPALASLAGPIAAYANLKAVLVFFVVVMVLLIGLYTTIYAFVYRVTGPPRYSAVDAPPPSRRTKRYTR